MGDSIKFSRVEFASVRATQASEWVFAEFHDSEGGVAISEITSGANAPDVIARLPELVARLGSVDSDSAVHDALGVGIGDLKSDRVLATAVSAIRTAVSVIQAQRARVSLAEHLGGNKLSSVQLYANINRSLLNKERTPKAFAAMAERAVNAGFEIVKCAPFDEVRPPSAPNAVMEIARPGIDRVAAVKAAVGPDVKVLVDCHSRFELQTAPLIEEELAKLDIGWFEEPVSPTANQDDLVEIAKPVSTPIAGGESGYGEDFFVDLVRSGAVKTIMPDIKYCGGVAESVRAGRVVSGFGAGVSLHSPSGPVSLLASAHATAAVSGALPLEHAVYETDWRAEVIEPAERVEGGRLWFPGGAGLGAVLNEAIIAKYGRRWKP